MDEHTQPDRATRRGRKQVEQIRSLQAKVAKLERGDGQWAEVEEAYHRLVESLGQGLLIVQDGRIVLANQKMATMTGYRIEEFQAMSAEEVLGLVHPDDRAAVWSRYRARLAGEEPPNPFEFRGMHRDGSVRWLQLHASRITYHGEAAVQIAYVDITDRKHLEQMKLESERQYQTLFERAPIGIGLAEMDGRVVAANGAMGEIFGYTVEELKHLDIRDLYENPDDRFALLEQVKRYGSISGFSVRLRHKDGRLVDVLIGISLIESQGRTLLQTTCVDITERKEAEDALKESESQLKRAQEVAHIGSWSLDIQTQRLVWSEETYRIFGLPLGQPLEEEVFLNCVHPEDLAMVQQAWAEALRGGRYDVEHRIMSDGQVKWVRERAELEFDAQGRPLRGIGTVQDITERRQSEKALNDSEEMFRTVFEQAAVGVAQVTPHGHFAKVNARFCEIVGYSEGELCAMNCRDITHPEDLHLDENRIARVLAGEMDSSEIEKRYVRRDGQSVWVSLYSSVVRDNEGKIKYAIAVVTDISQRKQMEEAIVEASRRLRETIRAANVGLWDWDLDTNQIKYSPEWKRQIGYEEHEIGDGYEEWESRVHPDDLAPALERINQAIADASGDYHVEFRFRHRDGSYRWILAQSSVICDEAGRRYRVLGSHIDITERKQMEDALRENEERLRLAHKATNDVVWDWDIIGDRQRWNQAATAVFGWKDIVEAPQTAAWWVERVHPEDRQRVHESFFAVVNDPRQDHWQDEYRFRKADGSYVEVFDHGYVLRNERGEAIRMIGAMLDITERKQWEQRLRAMSEMLDTAPSSITVHDFDGRFLYANDKTFELHGYDENEFLALNLSDLDVPESQALIAERMGVIARPGEACFEVSHFRKDGSRIPFEIYVKQVTWDGTPAILSVATDITERQAMECALREEKERAQRYLDLAGVMTIALDIHGNVTLANRNATEILGYDHSDIIDRAWFDCFLPKSNSGQVKADFEKIMSGEIESLEYYENPVLTQRGQERMIAWHNTIIKDVRGRIIGTLSSGVDITEQKRAAEALERHRAELQAIYNHAPVMMCVLDTDRRVVYANQAFTHFSGVSEKALRQGRACGVFGCINALEDPRGCGYGTACPDCELLRAIQDTLETGASHHDINHAATLEQNGIRREVFLTGATALIPAGGRRNVLMCLQDITQQTLAKQQAKRKQSELIHASRLATLGELASGLAHELGQPLSAVLLYTTACGQLISAKQPDLQRIGKNIEKIANQAERAKEIMVRVRALAQRQQPTMVGVDLNQTVTGLIDLVSWEIRQKGIQLDLDMDDRLPCVWGDTVQIEQVLLNLIRNAIEAMDIPEVEVRWLNICTRADEGQTAVVEVSDTGIGLPNGGVRRLFDAFFTTKADGLGIGLSISRTIMEMHDGSLEARSNVGSGSTFTMRLPVMAEGQRPEPSPDDRES